MCKQSSAPFIERHCFHGMMSKEGATHMVLWCGFVLRNQRVGTDDWTSFQREVGPTIAALFPVGFQAHLAFALSGHMLFSECNQREKRHFSFTIHMIYIITNHSVKHLHMQWFAFLPQFTRIIEWQTKQRTHYRRIHWVAD